ncbi:hypothetical protein QJS10_CPA01g00659 [Acorus calamus]|uniref:Uncharacterized protein n=1 Tax=Acorus calamus TaxID=4465 RepID=A0AAV9FM04_ACOCL|nr:hypothetical protein QJS10_CPA01g00659 [Acorus calamus]
MGQIFSVTKKHKEPAPNAENPPVEENIHQAQTQEELEKNNQRKEKIAELLAAISSVVTIALLSRLKSFDDGVLKNIFTLVTVFIFIFSSAAIHLLQTDQWKRENRKNIIIDVCMALAVILFWTFFIGCLIYMLLPTNWALAVLSLYIVWLLGVIGALVF